MVDADDFVAVGVIIGLFMVVICIFAFAGVLIGMLTAWLLSITPLGAFVENGLTAFGFPAQGQLINIGAALGFVAGFFKGIVEVTHKKE